MLKMIKALICLSRGLNPLVPPTDSVFFPPNYMTVLDERNSYWFTDFRGFGIMNVLIKYMY